MRISIWYDIFTVYITGLRISIASRLFNDPDSFLPHVFSKQNHLQFLFPTSYLAQSFPSCLPLLELKDLVKSQNTQLPCYMDPQCPSSDIAWGNHPPGRRGDPSHSDEILTSAVTCGVCGWCPKYTLHIHMEKMLRYTHIKIDGSTEIYLECIWVQVNKWMNKSINTKYNSNNRSFPVFIVCVYIYIYRCVFVLALLQAWMHRYSSMILQPEQRNQSLAAGPTHDPGWQEVFVSNTVQSKRKKDMHNSMEPPPHPRIPHLQISYKLVTLQGLPDTQDQPRSSKKGPKVMSCVLVCRIESGSIPNCATVSAPVAEGGT